MPDVRLIDANALQRAFDDAHKDEPDFFCCNFLNNAGNPSTEWDCVDDILENAPTIDAQPVKHGKWIPMDEYCAKCSVCGWWQKTNGKSCTGHANIHNAVYKWCTACGAKMDGDTDGNGND